MLPFDTYKIIDTHKLYGKVQKESSKLSKESNSELWVCLAKIVENRQSLAHPFKICDYFQVPYNLKKEGEFIWEKVHEIKLQVEQELNNLMPSGEYKLDWRDDNQSFSIFYKKDSYGNTNL